MIFFGCMFTLSSLTRHVLVIRLTTGQKRYGMMTSRMYSEENMDPILIAIAAFFLLSWRKTPAGQPSPDYLDRTTTATINGLFLLLVFFSHFMTYLPASHWPPLTSLWMKTKGELIVATFLFFSGFGIMTQIKRRGHQYVANFPLRRILFIWFKFAAAVTLFLVVTLLWHGQLTGGLIFKAYLGLASLGNSAWYIFAILCAYLMTYLAFSLIRKNSLAAIGLVAAMSVIYLIIASKLLPEYYASTFFCYVGGMLFAYCQQPLTTLITETRWHYSLAWLLAGTVFIGFYLVCAVERGTWVRLVAYQIDACAFAFLFVLLAMKVSLHNPMLRYIGGNAMFSLYILQRLPMNFGQRVGWQARPILFFFVALALTLGLGWLFDLIVDRSLRRLTHKA